MREGCRHALEGPRDEQRARRLALPDHRRDQAGKVAGPFGQSSDNCRCFGIGDDIGEMLEPAAFDGRCDDCPIDGKWRIVPRAVCANRPAHCLQMCKTLVVEGQDRQIAARDQPLAAVEDFLEDGLRNLHRIADDIQHFRRRCLPLQRVLRLAQQTHVLDRDHRLIGEILQQVDVLLRERFYHPLVGRDIADHLALVDQRHRQKGVCHVRHMDGSSLKDGAGAYGILGVHRHLAFAVKSHRLGRGPAMRDHSLQRIPSAPPNKRSILRAAKLCGAVEDRLEGRLFIEGGFRDDAKDVPRCSLTR